MTYVNTYGIESKLRTLTEEQRETNRLLKEILTQLEAQNMQRTLESGF